MNSDKDKLLKGFYHCIDCDRLFEAEVQRSSSVLCDKCGNAPSANKLNNAVYTSGDTAVEKKSQSEQPTNRVASRKKRGSRKVLYFSGLIILGLIGTMVFMKEGADELVDNTLEDKATKIQKQQEIVKVQYRNNVANLCNTIMNGLVKAENGSEASKYFYDSIGLEGDIKNYYEKNPIFVMGQPKAVITHIAYVRDVEPFVLGAVFKDESGKEFEASFIQGKRGYKIDWPFYVRYNSEQLEDFLNQSEVSEAEFRLYMRVLDIKDEVTLVFYPPVTNSEKSFDGMKSSSVRLPKSSEIVTAMMNVLNKENPMDEDYRKMTASRDAKGYHRVRVRLGLKINEGKANSLELVDFIANDWYGVDIENLEEF